MICKFALNLIPMETFAYLFWFYVVQAVASMLLFPIFKRTININQSSIALNFIADFIFYLLLLNVLSCFLTGNSPTLNFLRGVFHKPDVRSDIFIIHIVFIFGFLLSYFL